MTDTDRTIDVGCAEIILTVGADRVATLRLDHGKVNPLNEAMQDAIGRAAEIVDADEGIVALVVTGNERAFAAGVDITELVEHDQHSMAIRVRAMHAAFDAFAAVGKPVVAAINGFALGGGCELALCADYRIASERAVFGQPEVHLGLIPGAGGTQRLARLVGPSHAKAMILTGAQVPAAEALRMGLVNEVVPDDQVVSAATAWAAQFASHAPLALRRAKAVIDAGLDQTIAEGLVGEQEGFAAMFGTEDGKIGMRSFLDNGPGKAQFTGR